MSSLGKFPNGFNQVSRSAVAITVNGIDQALITTSSFTMYDGLVVSQSINSYNINAGTPTSNPWAANSTARFTVSELFPTPPLPEPIRNT